MTPDAITTRFDRGPAIPTLTIYHWGGTGPPVLLAHATGFHGLVWRPVAARLVAHGRRVWSFDFRGHGDSDPAPDRPGGGSDATDHDRADYDWADFGTDVGDVARHLGVAGDPRLVAAGHSKGAAAILLAELAAPGTFPRAWCFEPIVIRSDAPLQADHEFPLAIGARRRRAVWPSLDEAYASYAGRAPLDALDPDALRAYVDGGLRERADGSWELKCAPDTEASTFAHSTANGLWRLLGDVTARVHVVCGETTDAIVPRFAERIADHLPHGSLEVMPGLGHFGPLEDPDAAVASLLTFDAETRPPHVGGA